MSQDPRHVPHRLHGALETASALLNLPLDGHRLEALALELTGPVRALIAEVVAAAADDAPVRYALTRETDVDEACGVATTEYAGCTARIGTDVDLDSPAAVLAAELRARQPDVTATDVPTHTYLGLTVRPQSLHAWRWWLDLLSIDADSVTIQGTSAYAVGTKDTVAVQLRGDGVAELLADEAAARLMGLIAPSAP